MLYVYTPQYRWFYKKNTKEARPWHKTYTILFHLYRLQINWTSLKKLILRNLYFRVKSTKKSQIFNFPSVRRGFLCGWQDFIGKGLLGASKKWQCSISLIGRWPYRCFLYNCKALAFYVLLYMSIIHNKP